MIEKKDRKELVPEILRKSVELNEKRATQITDFIHQTLTPGGWKVTLPDGQIMSLKEYQNQARDDLAIGRVEQVAYFLLNIIENLEYHFEHVKEKFQNAYQGLLLSKQQLDYIFKDIEDQFEALLDKYDELEEEKERLAKKCKSLEKERQLLSLGYKEILETTEHRLKVVIKQIKKLQSSSENVDDTQEAINISIKNTIDIIEEKKEFYIKEALKELQRSSKLTKSEKQEEEVEEDQDLEEEEEE